MKDNLISLRRQIGLSQVALATLLGVSYSKYRREETAETPRNLFLFALKHLEAQHGASAKDKPYVRLPVGSILSTADFHQLPDGDGIWRKNPGGRTWTKLSDAGEPVGSAAVAAVTDESVAADIAAYKAKNRIE